MTIKDIAQIAGVSISTVSKIVNGKDQNINSETRERVLTEIPADTVEYTAVFFLEGWDIIKAIQNAACAAGFGR